MIEMECSFPTFWDTKTVNWILHYAFLWFRWVRKGTLKGTSNYLAEFQQTLKLTSSSCSFLTGVSQTLWNFTIDFYGKHFSK